MKKLNGIKKIWIVGFALLSMVMLSFVVKLTDKPVLSQTPCYGDCNSQKMGLLNTYNAASPSQRCSAVQQTVNSIIAGQCGCPGKPFDPCGLRQYAITTFPLCQFTNSSFISKCP